MRGDDVDARDDDAVDGVGARHQRGVQGGGHLADDLAWELSRYERVFTIPSARNPQEINDSFAATELALTQNELAMLNASVDARRG